MDNFLGNPFDQSEIDRIQEEIQKDLQKDNPGEASSGNPAFGVQPGSGEEFLPGEREIVPESIVKIDTGRTASMNEDDSFFKETVKSESKKGLNDKFKRFIAVVCIVSVLGGTMAGIAIPLTQAFIIPSVKGAESLSQPAEEPGFTFLKDSLEDIEASQKYDALSGVLSFADLIDAVEPAVVCISANKPEQSGGIFQIPPDNISPSGGSGIIFDKDHENLYIVTNNHVVTGATSVTVLLKGSEDVPARLVGKDADADLAVISVKISDLQKTGLNDFVIASFANSNSMRVGDFVIAIGNALGEGNTATFGFISAVGKEINVDGKPFTVLQTDAAINPGNSGGPLINLKGEVIGINMVKLVEARVEGMGYALTTDVAMPIIEQIRNLTPKPILGISGFNMTETVASAFSLPMMGVIVESVVSGSGAEKAGIKASDILTSFNGQAVLNMERLKEEVGKCNIGDTVEVKLIRDGKDAVTLNVTLLADNSANF